VWRADDGVIMGAAGDSAACDVVVATKLPAMGAMGVREWAVRRFVPALRRNLVRCALSDADIDILIGSGGDLIEVSGLGVMVHGAYAAVGAGAQVALGALYASTSRGPHGRVSTALKAAEEHTVNVRRPWTILHT
jgi:hypothetical protein